MMSSLAIVSSPTMSFSTRRITGKKRYVRENWTNFTFFVFAMFSLAMALAYQHGELHPRYGRRTSLFLGTTPVSAAVATAVLSAKGPRVGNPTMVSMAAGSSRTLIELSTRPESEESGKFQFEVTYLDEDDEQGLVVLRRANIDTGHASPKTVVKDGHAVYTRVIRVLKSPIVAFILAGNIASMVGILPVGTAGFVPAVAIFLGKKTKWAAPMFKRLRSVSMQAPAFRAVFAQLKKTSGKAISRLNKIQSKYPTLSDFLWFVDVGEKKSKSENDNDQNHDGARPSTAHATIA